MSERTIKNRKRRKLLAENDLTEKEIKCCIHQLGNFEGKSGLVDFASELCCVYDEMHNDMACWNLLADINDSLGVRWYLTDVYKGMKSTTRIKREHRICSDYIAWKKAREIKGEELKLVVEKEAAEREDEGEKDDKKKKKRKESKAEHELRKLSLSRYAFLNQVACPDDHLIHGHDISEKYGCSRAECQRILYGMRKESPEAEETKVESMKNEDAVDPWGRLTNFEKYDQETLERFVFEVAIAFLNEKLPDTLNVLLKRIMTGRDSKKGKCGPLFGEMDGVKKIDELIKARNEEISVG